MWVFDMTPKGSNAVTEYYPARSGNLRIELKFGAAVADGPYTLLFYGLMDSTSESAADTCVKKNW